MQVNCTGDQIEIFMGDNTTVSSVTSVSYGGHPLSLDNATNNGAEVIIVPVASCATSGSISVTIGSSTYTFSLG